MREEHRGTAEHSLYMLEEISRQQGCGEISIFCPTGQSTIAECSLQHARLVRFLDYLLRESHGRPVLLLSIGSASRFGNSRQYERLA